VEAKKKFGQHEKEAGGAVTAGDKTGKRWSKTFYKKKGGTELGRAARVCKGGLRSR